MGLRFLRLRLHGFKSFVEPTVLDILPGLTGIVGPNGCGKSNIVEALRWVMGETSAKSLRGGEMEDVIFAGTSVRPARQWAEVALTLEAPPGEAPHALAAEAKAGEAFEFDVLRRIERGGGSTYRVNGREWRARDVQLLFADAATGARSVAMVSQGKVGALVNARPEDRRTLLEEAAGITGLHARRHEAELKLRAAEANLARADDVLGTLEAQLALLKKQARQATRYRTLVSQIREAEEAMHAARLARAAADVASAESALCQAERRLAERAEAAAAAATRAAETEAALPPLREADAEARSAVERARAEAARAEAEAKGAAEALASAEAAVQRLARDLAHAERLRADAAAALARLAAEERQLTPLHEGAPGRIAEALSALTLAQEAVHAREVEAQAATEHAAAIAAQAQALAGRIRDAERALSNYAEEARRLAAERAALEAQMIAAAALDGAEALVREAEAALSAARADLETSEAARAAAHAAAVEALKRAQAAEAERTRFAAEARGLRDALAVREDELWPPLVDAISVPEGLETALGSALGEALEATADEAAPRHWRALPPLLPAQALPAGATPLSALVEAPAALSRALSQIGLVADTDTGERLSAFLRPGQTLVCREGSVWRWDGLVVRAGAPTAAATRLAQRNRLAALRARLAEAEAEAARAKADHERAAATEASAIAREQSAREARSAAERRLDAARRELASLTARATAASSRLAALTPQEERLAQARAEAEETLRALRAEAADLPPLAEADARRAEARAALAEARRAESDARAALEVARREAASLAARLAAIAEEKRAWQARAEEAEARLAELTARRAEAEAERARLAEAPARAAEARARAFDALAQAEQVRRISATALSTAEEEAAAAARAARAAEAEAAQAREALVRAEERLKQAKAQAADLARAVAERLGLSAETLAARVTVAEPLEETEANAARRLEKLTRERDGMGPVNLAAEAEMAEVEERIATLKAERADLSAAIAKLRAAIGALNREGRERLTARFSEVDRHFRDLFVRLFGGGKAHLALIDSDDPLEAGLEIMAEPPGKKLAALSLLSGGEQALTALALIFAVFLTNPAPICVLDEVDAPLDDANVNRFCSLLEEIARETGTRFLIVTHHRLTMARMDRLYGVTMAEHGVSQLVSVDLAAAETLVPQAMAAE